MLPILTTKKKLIKNPVRSIPAYEYAEHGFALWNPSASTFSLEIKRFWQLTSHTTTGQQQMEGNFHFTP